MNINWKVRLANKTFWLTAIPAFIVLIQVVADLFGFTLDIGNIGNKLISVVNAAFVCLAIVGVVNDPTTKGVSDSVQAMTYERPKE